jgi:dihydroorotate dehydrogenase (NAD+) catalytic subunit
MKPKRRVVPGTRARRTPTVRRIKPAIVPVPRARSMPSASPPQAGQASEAVRREARRIVAAHPSVGRPTAGHEVAALAAAAGDVTIELTVELGRGLTLATPLIAAAGAFGYGVEVADQVDLARLGCLVTRGTTLKPGAGHASPRMIEIPAGLLVGTGLQNPGIEVVLERYAPAWSGWPVPVIINLGGESIGEFVELARRIEGVPGVAGLELNLSCPNGARGRAAFGLDAGSASALVTAVRRATDLPLIAKLSPAASDVREIARAVEQAGADAISAVNTLPGLAVAPERDRPALAAGYGGICGPALRPVALRIVFEVAQVVDLPVIGIGGVASIDDVLDMLAVGASAVGVGVAALADPMLPVRLADELADACRAAGVGSALDLVGSALPVRPMSPSAQGAEYGRRAGRA